MSDYEKPLPCPFCGISDPELLTECTPEYIAVFVHCYSCLARGGVSAIEFGGLRTRENRNPFEIREALKQHIEWAITGWNMRIKKHKRRLDLP